MASTAVLFNRFGPYHLARLEAAGERGSVVGIEVFGEDRNYGWQANRMAKRFLRETLCPREGSHGYLQDVARRLVERLHAHQPSVVAVPGWTNHYAVAALRYCIESGTPAIVMSDSTTISPAHSKYREILKRRVVSLFSAGLVAGTPHRAYLASLGMPAERILPGYDVVDNAYFSNATAAVRELADETRLRLQLPPDYFLVSNRFIWEKNLPRLLQAYAVYRKRAGERAWALVLLGDGEERAALERQQEQLGLRGQIVMLGFRQYAEMPAFYGLARALILASISETWGLVVNEAMASGLPVLVSNRCGCVEDLVEEGRNGWTFDPYDIEGMADAMQKVSSASDAERDAMGAASRQIIGRWTPDLFAKNLWKAAELAVQAPRPRASLIDRALLWTLMHR